MQLNERRSSCNRSLMVLVVFCRANNKLMETKQLHVEDIHSFNIPNFVSCNLSIC